MWDNIFIFVHYIFCFYLICYINYLLYIIILSFICQKKLKSINIDKLESKNKLKLKKFYEKMHEHIKKNIKEKKKNNNKNYNR